MKKEDEIYEYSKKHYTEVYDRVYKQLEEKTTEKTTNRHIPASKQKEIENTAQLEAIKCTMIEGRKLLTLTLFNKIFLTH